LSGPQHKFLATPMLQRHVRHDAVTFICPVKRYFYDCARSFITNIQEEQ